MAGFPPATSQAPPPTVPGVTAPPAAPPRDLMQALAKRPEQASELVKQAIMILERAADMDERQGDRIQAAVTILRGPKRPEPEV